MTPLERMRCRFKPFPLPAKTPRAAPLTVGVYLLVDAGEVVYVGASVDIAQRLYSHLGSRGKRFDAAFWYPLPASVMCHYEGAFIRALLPRHNARAPAHTGCDNEILEGFGLVPHADEYEHARTAVALLSARQSPRRRAADLIPAVPQ